MPDLEALLSQLDDHADVCGSTDHIKRTSFVGYWAWKNGGFRTDVIGASLDMSPKALYGPSLSMMTILWSRSLHKIPTLEQTQLLALVLPRRWARNYFSSRRDRHH